MIEDTTQEIGQPKKTTSILSKIGVKVKIQAILRPHQQANVTTIAKVDWFMALK